MRPEDLEQLRGIALDHASKWILVGVPPERLVGMAITFATAYELPEELSAIYVCAVDAFAKRLSAGGTA